MGFLSGLLSPALTVATGAAGALQGAEANATESKRNAVLQAIAFERQQHEQALRDALTQAQTSLAGANANRILNPPDSYSPVQGVDENGKPVVERFSKNTGETTPTGLAGKPVAPVMGSPEWIDAQRKKAQITAEYAPPPARYTFPVGADSTGKPIIMRGNTRTGDLEPTGQNAKPPAKSSSVAGERTAAQVGVARTQAIQADKDMTEFEAGIASGKVRLDPAGFYLAKKVLSAPPGSATVSEVLLNTQYPDLARYVRSARQIAVAERLITPRGGSNAMSAQETALSMAGALGDPKQVQQSQSYRRALITGLHAEDGASASPTGSQPAPQSANPFSDLTPSSGHDD